MNVIHISNALFKNYFSDNDFIEAGLSGMGYSRRSYKKTIPNCKFIRGLFQTDFFLK
jgi:hypothetical protein